MCVSLQPNNNVSVSVFDSVLGPLQSVMQEPHSDDDDSEDEEDNDMDSDGEQPAHAHLPHHQRR